MMQASNENNISPFESISNSNTDSTFTIVKNGFLSVKVYVCFANDEVLAGCPKLGHATL